MQYVALRTMKAEGKVFNKGDLCPAENWKTRRSLLSCGRIRLATPEDITGDQAEIPVEKAVTEVPVIAPTDKVLIPEPAKPRKPAKKKKRRR